MLPLARSIISNIYRPLSPILFSKNALGVRTDPVSDLLCCVPLDPQFPTSREVVQLGAKTVLSGRFGTSLMFRIMLPHRIASRNPLEAYRLKTELTLMGPE